MKSKKKLIVSAVLMLIVLIQCSSLKYLDTANINKDKLIEKLVSIYGENALTPQKNQWKKFIAHTGFSEDRIVILELVEFNAKINSDSKSGQAVYEMYLNETRKHLAERGAQILYQAKADHGLIGKNSSGWDQVIFIEYPSRAACIDMLIDPEYIETWKLKKSALKRIRQLVTNAGPYSKPRFLANIIYGAVELKPVKIDADALSRQLASITTNPLFEPTARQWKKLIEFPGFSSTPYVNLNLTRLNKKAQYPQPKEPNESGLEAYKKYGKEAAPLLVARRGWPLLVGKVEQLLTGDNDQKWDLISFVAWPSRAAIVDMGLDPNYRPAWKHRKAGVAQAIAIATTIIEK